MAKADQRYKKTFSTILITTFAFLVNYLITFLLAPVITDSVGTEAYGFVSLAKNIAQYASFITMALNSFAVRFISIAYHKEDYDRANMYFSTTFIGDTVLGAGLMAIFLVCIAFLEKIFIIPEAIVTDVKFLFLFVFIKFFLVTCVSVYHSGGVIANKLNIGGVYKLFSYLTESAVLIVLFWTMKPHVAYVGLGILAASLVENYSYVHLTHKYTPELRVDRKKFNMKAINELVVNGIWSTINSFGSFLHNGLDLAVCNLLVSPVAMGQLAIADTVHLIFSSIVRLVADAFQPLYLKAYAKKDMEGLLKDLNLAMLITSMISNVVFAGFFALGLVYFKLWVPNQDIYVIMKLSVISAAARIGTGIIYPYYAVYNLTLKKKWPAVATLVSGACNLVSMYVFIKYFHTGLYTVVWTTVVIMSFLTMVFHPLYVCHVLKLKWYALYPAMLRCLISCAVLVAAFKGFTLLYMPSGWVGLILTAVVYAAIGALIHVGITFNAQQRQAALRFLKKKLKRA